MPKYPQFESIRRLFSKGLPVMVTKGDIILGLESEPNGVYYISTGYVKQYSIKNNGDQSVHLIYGSGEIFPLIWAYLNIEPEAHYYEAISDSLLWRISRDWFHEFATRRLEICYGLSLQLAQQYRIFADRIENLEYKKASQRVAYRILYLSSRFGVRHGKTMVIDVPITHELFASSVNLARESVSREFEKLEHQNIVKRRGRKILIHDMDALAAIVGGYSAGTEGG